MKQPKTSHVQSITISASAMNEAAAAHGGTADINAKQDYDFMFNRNFADPDGHVWEAMWMDMSEMPPAAS